MNRKSTIYSQIIGIFVLLLGIGPLNARSVAVDHAFAYAEGAPPLVSKEAREPINPASLVKPATTYWAIKTLGPDYRFRTRWVRTPGSQLKGEVLVGDLWVLGGRDPDFQHENAWEMAKQLRALGITKVEGSLTVTDNFWIGWEGGSEAKPVSDKQRRLKMAKRLAKVLDSSTWNASLLKAYQTWAMEKGYDPTLTPTLAFTELIEQANPPKSWIPLVDHEGNPLMDLLRRFNAYSNNDLERLEYTLGSPAELVSFLERSLPEGMAPTELETLSGLGRNRWHAEGITSLLKALDHTLQDFGLTLEDVLPVPGCDPGTLRRYKKLGRKFPGAITAKTGTLIQTDGGVGLLAGRLDRGHEPPVYFCFANTRTGSNVASTRKTLESVALETLSAFEPDALTCQTPLPSADADVIIQRYELSNPRSAAESP